MKTTKGRYRIGRVLFAVFIAVLGIVPSAFSQTDIEKNFTKSNTADFSGTYEFSGLLEDSSTYSGTLKLEKLNTYTTPLGNILQSFKMTYDFGESKSTGIAVYDGSRLYYAAGEGNHKDFYLLLLSRLELAGPEQANLWDYHAKNRDAKSGQYYNWKEAPWYGYLDPETEGYGFWFWVDGVWGQFSTRRSAFPHVGDSTSYLMVELKKTGEFGKKKENLYPEGFTEYGGFDVSQEGTNVRIDLSYLKKGSDESYWGTGFLTTHPVTGDSILVAMLGGPVSFSIGWMDIVGDKFVGVWAPGDGVYQSSEEWVVPEDVIKKNPALFK